jgi:hypothetical protein
LRLCILVIIFTPSNSAEDVEAQLSCVATKNPTANSSVWVKRLWLTVLILRVAGGWLAGKMGKQFTIFHKHGTVIMVKRRKRTCDHQVMSRNLVGGMNLLGTLA